MSSDRLMYREAPIELVTYSPEWRGRFLAEVALLRVTLGPWLVADLEHIGSTAVPGLLAKPIVDVMGPIESLEMSQAVIAAAERVGYCYFPYKPDQMHWFCKPSPNFRTHHLHLVRYRSSEWFDRLAFRDALREDATLAAEYRDLKLELYAQHRHDREAYTDGKSVFVRAAVDKWRSRGLSAA